ncbi:hypothetical protein ABZ419_09195 [Streptomyces cinnamoneus]|uniref:hypothetical protein n=1 Tax=Streptomyces cinnamoneus TaxID=53446 RepID=UPI0033FA1023
MAADSVIRTGDLLLVRFDQPPPPKSQLLVPVLMWPLPLSGSGEDVLVEGRPVCLEDDEYPEEAGPSTLLDYTVVAAPKPYVEGKGVLRLTLEPSNKTAHTTADGVKVLIRGRSFPAAFDVSVPAAQAQENGAPLYDSTTSYPGRAKFLTWSGTVAAG